MKRGFWPFFAMALMGVNPIITKIKSFTAGHSKYGRHQGPKEMARRVSQRERGIIK